MKRNILIAILLILLIAAIGVLIILTKNGGTFSPKPSPAPTLEPTLAPTEEQKIFPNITLKTPIGNWVLYKMQSSINSEGNQKLYKEQVPAEWANSMPTLNITDTDFLYSPYETSVSGTFVKNINDASYDWIRTLATPIGDISGIFNITKVRSEGIDYAPADAYSNGGQILCYCYNSDKDEIVIIKDGGEGTDITDYLYFQRD